MNDILINIIYKGGNKIKIWKKCHRVPFNQTTPRCVTYNIIVEKTSTKWKQFGVVSTLQRLPLHQCSTLERDASHAAVIQSCQFFSFPTSLCSIGKNHRPHKMCSIIIIIILSHRHQPVCKSTFIIFHHILHSTTYQFI